MKRIISLVLVFSLCISSSFAVYDIDPDSAALFSLDSDYGIETASADDSWYSSVLQNLEWIMFDIADLLEFANEETSAFYTFMYEDVYSDLADICEFLYDLNNNILGGTKNGTVLSWLNSLTTYFADTANWLGVYDGGKQLNVLLETIDSSIGDSNSILNSLYSSFGDWVVDWASGYTLPSGTYFLTYDGTEVKSTSALSMPVLLARGLRGLASFMQLSSGYNYLNYAGQTVVASEDLTFTQLFNQSIRGLASRFVLPAGYAYLNFAGQDVVASEDLNFTQLFNQSIRGLASSFYVPAELSYLSSSGDPVSSEGALRFSSLLRLGILGLSDNLKDISTGSFSLSLYDSETAVQGSSSASTMGKMIQGYFDAIQDDLGALTFVYADSDSVQAKKDAANNSAAVTDSFLDPDADASLSVSDIGDAAAAVVGVKDLFDTGVSVDLVFEQLESSGPLSFFTSETASQLNTVSATLSDEDDDFIHFYDPDNSEFFELIGKGGD